MNGEVSQFKTAALAPDVLRLEVPSAFASAPMGGLSSRYTFVSTASIIDALRERDWVPVHAEEQRVRTVARLGFQKHVIRFRLACQVTTLDEWNVELVLSNSHDAASAYIVQVGIFRRLCSNGLVVSEQGFEAIRFRHARLQASQVVDASFRVMESAPIVGARIASFKSRALLDSEAEAFSRQALLLRYENPEGAPIGPRVLLNSRRPEDESNALWTVFNKVQENLIKGGLSDHRLDRRGRLRTLRGLTGIDSKLDLNQSLWSLAEKALANSFAE